MALAIESNKYMEYRLNTVKEDSLTVDLVRNNGKTKYPTDTLQTTNK